MPSNEFDDDPPMPLPVRSTYHFRVHGLPQTKGSTRSFKSKSTGQSVTINDNNKCAAWARSVNYEARRVRVGQVWTGAVRLNLTFYMAKPVYVRKGEARGKKFYACRKPDLDKLTRAVKDALTNVLYRDDSQVVQMEIGKEYHDYPGVEVILMRLGDEEGQV